MFTPNIYYVGDILVIDDKVAMANLITLIVTKKFIQNDSDKTPS